MRWHGTAGWLHSRRPQNDSPMLLACQDFAPCPCRHSPIDPRFPFSHVSALRPSLLHCRSPLPFFPSQSVPWDIAYHVAVHWEAGKLPDSSPLPASSAAAMAASARTAATGRHQGPSALLTRRAGGGGGGRGGGMTGGHAGTGRSSREPPGTDSGHEGLPFIHNGGGKWLEQVWTQQQGASRYRQGPEGLSL